MEGSRTNLVCTIGGYFLVTGFFAGDFLAAVLAGAFFTGDLVAAFVDGFAVFGAAFLVPETGLTPAAFA